MFKRLTLTQALFLAILAAIGLGLLAPELSQSLKPIGFLFLSLLKMFIAPIIFFSIVAGIASLPQVGQLRRMGAVTLVYFLSTPVIAVATGLLFVHWFDPGLHGNANALRALTGEGGGATPAVRAFGPSFFGELFVNPVKALAETKVLAICVFAILFGAALQALKPKSERLVALCESVNDAFMVLLKWVMGLAPIGLFALVASMVGSLGLQTFRLLGWFIVTVLAATLWHGLVNLMLVQRLVAGRPIGSSLRAMSDALVVAFSTSSSNATLPVTLKTAQEKLGVSEASARLVVPLGATVNMDGTALYEAIAAIFIAQLYGIPLSFGDELIIFFMAMVTAIGAPGIPSAGMVTMILVLEAVGLPIEGIGILLTVDRFLDAFRTAVNVEGDMIGACVVERFGLTRI